MVFWFKGTGMQRRSASSQTMFCLKYLISVSFATIDSPAFGNGSYWHKYANDGDKSYLRHHAVSISKCSAQLELQSGRVWVSGQQSLSLWTIAPIVTAATALHLKTKTMSSLHWSYPDRVCCVDLDVKGSQLGKIAMAMQEPFPILTRLSMGSRDSEDGGLLPALPGGFLGGYVPCLRKFELCSISFPLATLKTLLLSASDLVELKLDHIPPTSYISPEMMVTHLAALPRLKTLHLGFQSVTSYPDQMLHPETRIVLPTLIFLFFTGVCTWLEDFLAQIDAPQLGSIVIYYSDQDANFKVPQLSEFINRSESLMETLSGQCDMNLNKYDATTVDLCIGRATRAKAEYWGYVFGISVCFLCKGADRQILHIGCVFSWISPILSRMVHFTIDSEWLTGEDPSEPEDLEDTDWVPVLHPFSSVKTLFVGRNIAEQFSCALENISTATVTEVLPALQLLCAEDQPSSSINHFINLRRDSGRPVTITNTKNKFERLRFYP